MANEIYLFRGDDPDMQKAFLRARETFRFFWREQFWEQRRMIPGLSLSCVKLPFSDSDLDDPDSEVEHMWINEVDFDGKNVSGKLINAPRYLESVQEEDHISAPWGALSDWMYARGDNTVYGAFSVNYMRAKMDAAERKQHDQAWGLDFGNPKEEKILPLDEGSKSGLLGRLFGGKPSVDDPDPNVDHPMAINMVEMYAGQLKTDPEVLSYKDEKGWTQLHHHALAGNHAIVELFIKTGADTEELTPEGVSAEALARVLHWEKLANTISAHG